MTRGGDGRSEASRDGLFHPDWALKYADSSLRSDNSRGDFALPMMNSAYKTPPNLSTVEQLLDEVDEWSGRVQEVRQRLGRLPRASEAYLDLLPDLEVELDTLRLKTQHALEALEEFEDSLPESD